MPIMGTKRVYLQNQYQGSRSSRNCQSIELPIRTHVRNRFTRWQDIMEARSLVLGEDRQPGPYLPAYSVGVKWELAMGVHISLLLSVPKLDRNYCWTRSSYHSGLIFQTSLLFYPEITLCSSCTTNLTSFSSSILVVDSNMWSILAFSYTMIRVCIARLISLIRPENLFQINNFFSADARNRTAAGFVVFIHLNWAIYFSLFYTF